MDCKIEILGSFKIIKKQPNIIQKNKDRLREYCDRSKTLIAQVSWYHIVEGFVELAVLFACYI